MTAEVVVAAPWEHVLGPAMSGAACRAHGLAPLPFVVPVGRWASPANASDRVLLGHCVGSVLDVGCGPGRMAAHLSRVGHRVLGVDILPEAVEMTRRRGVPAAHQDVFDPLPGEGRWDTALLADGNIGIGGDPVALLRRLAVALAPEGRAVVDLAAPGTGLQRRLVVLEAEGLHSVPFAWALVGPERIEDVARAAGLAVLDLDDHEGRWFAVVGKEQS